MAVTTLVLISAAGSPAVADDGRHQIRPGETLSEVAQRLGVSVDALQYANRIADADRVVAGTWLTVPRGARSDGPGRRSHVVAPGENLSSIARRYGVSTSALASANDIANPNLVVIGRRLEVPESATGGSDEWPAALRRSPDRQALVPTFELWATHYGVPADLLQATTWLESGWQPGVVSSTGAVGIGQLMPDTVDFMRSVIGDSSLDPTDPSDNIRMSARYLRWLLGQTGGDSNRALAAYYQGLRALQERGVYRETLAYVIGVQRLRPRF